MQAQHPPASDSPIPSRIANPQNVHDLPYPHPLAASPPSHTPPPPSPRDSQAQAPAAPARPPSRQARAFDPPGHGPADSRWGGRVPYPPRHTGNVEANMDAPNVPCGTVEMLVEVQKRVGKFLKPIFNFGPKSLNLNCDSHVTSRDTASASASASDSEGDARGVGRALRNASGVTPACDRTPKKSAEAGQLTGGDPWDELEIAGTG